MNRKWNSAFVLIAAGSLACLASTSGAETVLGHFQLPATRGWPTFMTLDIPLAGQCLRKTNDIRLEGCGETLSLDYIQVF